MPCGYKLSPAAQGNLACRSYFSNPHFSLPCVRGGGRRGNEPDGGVVDLTRSLASLSEGGVCEADGRSHHILGAFLRGEKALSWQSPGGALTTCELRNGTWSVPFLDRGGVLLAPPRRWRVVQYLCWRRDERSRLMIRGLLCGAGSSIFPTKISPSPVKTVDNRQKACYHAEPRNEKIR